MIRHICAEVLLTLLINIEGTFCLNPPQDVEIVRSNLQWKKPPDGDDSFLYSLQYKPGSKTDDEWHNVTSYNPTELRFQITPEFYRAIFRVRAEKGNDVSEWKYSNAVKCADANSCVPVLKLDVDHEKVSVTMEDMDDSLDKEYGVHIEFNLLIWKVKNGVYSKVESFITKSRNKPIYGLESGQNYCFQIQYLHYEKAYGNVSNQICAIIPETPETEKSRTLLFSILTSLLVTAMGGVCIFLLFKHHKKVKELLQPLRLGIPDHILEFFRSEEFHLQACPSPSTQSLQSCDIITVIEDSNLEQKGQEEEQEIVILT